MGTTLTLIAEEKLSVGVWSGIAVFHLGKCFETRCALRDASEPTKTWNCHADLKAALGSRMYVTGWPPDYGAMEAYAYEKIATSNATYWVTESALLMIEDAVLEGVQAFAIGTEGELRFLCYEM